jgi:hypothetical protein
MKVINNQANRRVRKPARRRTKRRRPRESEHRSDQPGDASRNQQNQSDQKKVSWLRSPQLLQHEQEWEEHLSGESPSGISGSNKKQAPSAHVSRFGLCTNGVEKLGRIECKSLHGKSAWWLPTIGIARAPAIA